MTAYSWLSGVSGDWSTDADWNGGEPSTSDADATIAAAGTYTVTISSDEGFAVNSVKLNAAGAMLDVEGTLTLGSGFNIAAGKITGAGFLQINGGTIGGGTVSVANQSISGAVSLGASLTDSGTVSLGSSGSDTLALGSNTLTLTGTGTTVAGSLSGAGMLALAGGSQAVNTGASLGQSKLAMSGNDSLTVNASMSYAGTFTEAAGTTLAIATGKTLTLTGTGILSGTVNGAIAVAGGSLMLNTAGTGAKLTETGGMLAVSRSLTYAGTLADTGGNIALNGKTLIITGALNLTGVTFTTAGTLCMKGTTVTGGFTAKAGSQIFNFGNQTDSGVITLGDATHAGLFVNVAGGTLTLNDGMAAGSSGPAGSRGADVTKPTNPKSVFQNKGHLVAAKGGGRGGVRGRYPDLAVTSATVIAVAVQNFNTGTVSVNAGTLEIDGSFANANTAAGAISIAAGTALDLEGGGSSAAGAFKVAAGGMLDFGGGTFSLTQGTVQGAAALTGGTLEVGANAVTINGAFTQSGGSILDGSDVVTIAGAASFGGGTGVAGETGTGRTVLEGRTTVAIDVALDGGRVLENEGTLFWTAGDFELGRNPAGGSTGGARLRNDAGATFIIDGDGVIGSYLGTNALINAGTMIKSVSAGSVTVAATFLNQGVVSVTTGTLELTQMVFGTGGRFRISGGSTLQADAALPSSQALLFGIGGGKLVVNDAAAFGATISGFGAGDTVDLTAFAFSGKPKASFVENAKKTQGVLTVTDGKESLNITLFGQYVAAGFHLAKDSGTGTAITYGPAPAVHPELAAGH